MAKKAKKETKQSGQSEIDDNKLYFIADLVQVLGVGRRTICRYKRDRGLPLSGVNRGSILGADLKQWLKNFSV